MKKNSVHEFGTLVVVVLAIITTAGGADGVEEHTSLSLPGPYCIIERASDDYEAHKAHVLDELANVTPTIPGYSYSTTFPPPGSAAAHDVVHGAADCIPGVGVSECVGCLIGAKLSLGSQICAYDLYGVVKLPLCSMNFVPVAAV
ncbi:unnamed protein product [Linum trigynum]|uniref:Gnk2-homologous domain-containing protein n=1 Tax=Linum trigynum TaxID=586398 RepID=A0AAV2CBJ8_9ROSI